MHRTRNEWSHTKEDDALTPTTNQMTGRTIDDSFSPQEKTAP